MMDIEISDEMHDNIRDFKKINNDLVKGINQLGNNIIDVSNQFAILWILTLIVYWFK